MVINDIPFKINHSNSLPPPYEVFKLVMIPKPNKDHMTIKGWRPIVLINTTSKLGEKCIPDCLQ